MGLHLGLRGNAWDAVPSPAKSPRFLAHPPDPKSILYTVFSENTRISAEKTKLVKLCLFSLFRCPRSDSRRAGFPRRLRHRLGDRRADALVKRLGDDVIRAQLVLSHKPRNRVARRNLHRLVDVLGAAIERAAENAGERQHVVDLVFVVAAAAADNRPLKFEEFEELTGQKVYVSATPADYELEKSGGLVVEQVVRPTGLLDPPIEVRPTKNQVDDLVEEIRKRSEKDERVLVTTLTKRMAEELDDYLRRIGIRVRYIHSDVDTAERVEIIEDFKAGMFDVLVGVNLLREGLDIPSVSLVAILDADKEGFLRTGRALTQTAGRAARNVNGMVIMYADSVTPSMEQTIRETNRRRSKQMAYNKLHNITPKQIEVKQNILASELTQSSKGKPAKGAVGSTTGRVSAANSYDDPTYIPNPSDLGRGEVTVGFGHASKRKDGAAFVDGYVTADLAAVLQDPVIRSMSRDQIEKMIEEDRRRMKKSAADLDFSEAAKYRDEMWALQEYLKVWKDK